MNQPFNYTSDAEKMYQSLIRVDANWPQDLRDRFEEARRQIEGFDPDLEHRVVSDYIADKLKS